MALGIIGGMFVATALSLLVVPSFYVLMDDFLGLFRRGKNVEGASEVPEELLSNDSNPEDSRA